MDDADGGPLGLQELGESWGARALGLYPEGEPLESPPDEERLEGPERRPQHLVREPDAVEQGLLRGDDGPRDDIAVAPQVLRRAVEHAVDSECEGTLVDWRRKGVVRQGRRPQALPVVYPPPAVRDHHRRVRGSLD